MRELDHGDAPLTAGRVRLSAILPIRARFSRELPGQQQWRHHPQQRQPRQLRADLLVRGLQLAVVQRVEGLATRDLCAHDRTRTGADHQVRASSGRRRRRPAP